MISLQKCLLDFLYMVMYVAWHTHVEVRGQTGDSVLFFHNVGLLDRTPDWIQAWWQVSLPVGPPHWPMCSSSWQQTPILLPQCLQHVLTDVRHHNWSVFYYDFFCLFSFVFGGKNKFLKVKKSYLVAPESSSFLRNGPPYRGLWAFSEWSCLLSCACPESLALVHVGKRN